MMSNATCSLALASRRVYPGGPDGGDKPRRSRSAFSLLEVVVAMAIFLASIIVLGDIVNNASDMALDVQIQDQANLRCQGKMAEVMVGAQSMSSTGGFSAFSDASGEGWQWSMESAEVPGVTGLFEVKITVQYERKDGKIVESRLSQMLIDPSLRGSTMDRPTSTTTSTTTTTGGTP